MSASAQIRLDADVVECSGWVSGTVTWSGNHRHDRVGIALRYRTHGRGDTDSAVVATADLGTADTGEQRFQLAVPALGPVTYHGKLLRIIWQAVVRIPLNRGLSLRSNETTSLDLTVVPFGWSSLRSPEANQVAPPAPWGTPEGPGELR
jgi:hypothetical protein